MTEIEYQEFVRHCPYDAMGDYSMFRKEQRIKKLSKAGELTKKHMEDILSEIKKGEVTRVEFNNAQLHKFFPYNYSPAMMKREILEILKIYKKQYSEK